MGKPLPDVSIAVLTDEEHISEKGVSELLVKGPNVMMGYYGMDSKDFFIDGYFCTGDIARIDDERVLCICLK